MCLCVFHGHTTELEPSRKDSTPGLRADSYLQGPPGPEAGARRALSLPVACCPLGRALGLLDPLLPRPRENPGSAHRSHCGRCVQHGCRVSTHSHGATDPPHPCWPFLQQLSQHIPALPSLRSLCQHCPHPVVWGSCLPMLQMWSAQSCGQYLHRTKATHHLGFDHLYMGMRMEAEGCSRPLLMLRLVGYYLRFSWSPLLLIPTQMAAISTQSRAHLCLHVLHPAVPHTV